MRARSCAFHEAAGLQFRNKEKARKRYVTDSELDALLAAAKPRMRTLIAFAYATGMRQSDVLSLELTAATDAGIVYSDGKTDGDHLIA